MEVPVVTFRVETPEVVTDVGLNETVAPVGTPLTLNVTLPVKLLFGVTVTV